MNNKNKSQNTSKITESKRQASKDNSFTSNTSLVKTRSSLIQSTQKLKENIKPSSNKTNSFIKISKSRASISGAPTTALSYKKAVSSSQPSNSKDRTSSFVPITLIQIQLFKANLLKKIMIAY